MGRRIESELEMGDLVRLDPLAEGSPWSYACRALGGRGNLLALYAIVLALLAAIGHQIVTPEFQQPLVCPAAGLVFGFLWLGDRRFWPQLLLTQFVVEFATGLLVSELPWMSLLVGASAHSLSALVGATFARRRLGQSAAVRVTMLAQFMLAAVIAALVSAPLSGAAGVLAGADSPLQWLLVAILADLLGGLLIAPILLTWGIPRRATFPPLTRWMILELVLLTFLQGLIVLFVFTAPPFGVAELRLPPALVLPSMLYVAVRFPPRWGMLLVLGTALFSSGLVASGADPYAVENLFARAIWIQVTAAIVVSLAIVLMAYLTSHRLVMADLANAEARYRSFVELSSEAMWRVELRQPMLLSMSAAQQCAWLRAHARIVEFSDSYAAISGPGDPANWSDEVPWVPALEARLGSVPGGNTTIAGLPFTVGDGADRRSFLSSFQGVVRDGQLLRLWGVARDVSELVMLNVQLHREQGRLKRYSLRVVKVEEQARRATAMDLHDGIGQELVGLSLTLKALGNQLVPEQRQLVDVLRGRIDFMQSRTRELISDLSPPGLYDLGLAAALQWLVDELRVRNGLEVALDCRVDESRLWLELRIVAFKVARELLRNVAKHARVDHATLYIRGDDQVLHLSVQDEGRGFEWNPELQGNLRGGFGLLSVVERVAGEGGSLSVDTAPTRGATVTIEFPLRSAIRRGREPRSVGA